MSLIKVTMFRDSTSMQCCVREKTGMQVKCAISRWEELTFDRDLHLAVDRRRNTVRSFALVKSGTVTRNVWNDHHRAQHSEPWRNSTTRQLSFKHPCRQRFNDGH